MNGKPCVPIVNDQILPEFLQARHLENAVKKSEIKLKIFSGTTNTVLSQEIAWYKGLNLGNINIKRFADGEIYIQESVKDLASKKISINDRVVFSPDVGFARARAFAKKCF
ncbi:OLC1v1016043C1 [Oldenlandia corymbosa var. corymbosa]|uniref:OLC1v1016043C1 n=1 Tax=Oldenlandia corymbosa var. corymbosa TaxID=529605 RepID=A0AAV1E781_OLDCO|nr:OLC1v1016043C1 [Oldenlandia corymbosa var. corymbosa]